MIITPELIEKASKAVYDVAFEGRTIPWEKATIADRQKEYVRSYARAALTAILPDIIEAIAKTQDAKAEFYRKLLNMHSMPPTTPELVTEFRLMETKMVMSEDCAADIRASLADKER